MKFLPVPALTLLSNCWAVNPSAADISWAESQAKVFIPEEFITDWRKPIEPWRIRGLVENTTTTTTTTTTPTTETGVTTTATPPGPPHEELVTWFNQEVDNLFRKRRLKSVCDSISTFSCSPIEESRIEDLLWDHRGLTQDTLYEYRFRKTLLQSPMPRTLKLKNGTLLYFQDKSARIRLSLAKGDAPSLVPLDWQFLVRRLSSEKLSRLLMAVEFAPGESPAVIKGVQRVVEDHWVEEDLQKYHPIKHRRLYAVPADSEEGKVLSGRENQNRAFNIWDRQFYTPGELVRDCITGGGWICPDSEMPDRLSHLLSQQSYSPGKRNDISRGDSTIFGKIMGSIPPNLQIALNMALERSVGSLKQRGFHSIPASIVVPEFENNVDSNVMFLLPPTIEDREKPWVPSSLKHFVESDADVLSKLHRDHRTWPHLARALRLDPSLVRRWLYGEEMKSSDSNKTSMYSRTPTGKRPVALIAYALRLPKLIFRAMSLGALRFAKLYVDLIAKWYTTDGNPEPPVIRQYRSQLDRALNFRPQSEKAGEKSASRMSEAPGGVNKTFETPTEKRLELLRLYERLLKTEISPIKSSGWERVDFEWAWPQKPDPAWLLSNVESHVGMPDEHSITLYGAWEPDGLTSIDGELHLKPATVLSNIFVKIGAPLASALELSDLDIVGFEFVNLTNVSDSSFRKCLGKYRRGGVCDHLHPVWRYRIPKPSHDMKIQLTEAELIRGFPHKRVNMVAFQWANMRPTLDSLDEGVLERNISEADQKFIPKWQPRSVPTSVRIDSMRLHIPRRTFEVDEEIMSELIGRNIANEGAQRNGQDALNKRAAELRSIIMTKAEQRGDLFETSPKEHQVALVVMPRPSAPAPIAFESSDKKLEMNSTNVSELNPSPQRPLQSDDWIPRARFDHHVKFWGTLPSKLRFKLRSIGLDRAGVVPRGFQLPISAQTAADASLVRSGSQALHENRGRPFLSKEGIVINSDFRKPDLFLVDVHVIKDLPVEAPLMNINAIKRQNLMTSFALNEFAEGRLVDETRSMDSDTKEKLLQFLRRRLESKMADLAKTSSPIEEAPTTTSQDASSENSQGATVNALDSTAINKRHEELGLSAEEEAPAISNEQIDSYTARELGNDAAPTASVIEALRQVAVDRDLNTIVTETLGEIEASVMDLIKDVTIIEIMEDPNTGQTISRKVQLELNAGTEAPNAEEYSRPERTIAFEIPTLNDDGTESFVEILIPVKALRDPAAVSRIIQETHHVNKPEADRLAEEIVKLVENYEDEDFDALLDVLDDYNRNDLDFS